MPQSPLDLLKSFAMRGVPKPTPPTETQREDNDFRAQAMQDQEPFGLRSIGRNLLDTFTDGLTGDPFTDSPSVAKGLTRPSLGSKVGHLAAAAPMLPKLSKLPVIAPEAYQDVKAGGLRLYSRLTDAFAKAPGTMAPDKIRSIAKQGASAEEVNLRKLEEFLQGRQPMERIPREDVMGHLAANPLELDVVRKKAAPAELPPQLRAEQEIAVLEHELDTRYGGQWDLTSITPDERARHAALTQQRDAGTTINNPADWNIPDNNPQYSFLQTPGPSENYGESLIKMPLSKQMLADKDDIIAAGGRFPHDTMVRDSGETPYPDFQSGHFTDDPNTLVWARHNDRWLQNKPNEDAYPEVVGAAGKGRFIEEIQSDWERQGRDYGYKGVSDPNEFWETPQQSSSGPNLWLSQHRWVKGPNGTPVTAVGEGPDANSGLQSIFDEHAPPDLPYKAAPHELALKQQLLDAADDPSLEWLGVADADTVSAMEGHPTVRDGTRLWYDEKNPTALEKLLKPLGGDVKYGNLPGRRYDHPSELATLADDRGKVIVDVNDEVDHNMPRSQVHQNAVASVIPGHTPISVKNQMTFPKETPGPGMWKANLTPELKALIKERGFPAMAALLAMQQASKRMTDPKDEY